MSLGSVGLPHFRDHADPIADMLWDVRMFSGSEDDLLIFHASDGPASAACGHGKILQHAWPKPRPWPICIRLLVN